MVVAGLWVVWFSTPELQQGALFLLPFALLVVLWRAGVDPTPILDRIARRQDRPGRRPAAVSRRPSPVEVIVSGGRLIARSLAGRAPPSRVAAAA